MGHFVLNAVVKTSKIRSEKLTLDLATWRSLETLTVVIDTLVQ